MFNEYQISDFFEGTTLPQHFHINRLDNMPALPPKILSPHKHCFYEVLFIEHGEMKQNIDYQAYDIESETLFFISQGQLHNWGKTNTEAIKGYRLMFTEDFFLFNPIDKNFLFDLVFLDNIYFYPKMNLKKAYNQSIYTYFDLLYQEYQRKDSSEKVLQTLLYLILTEVQRLISDRNPHHSQTKNLTTFKIFIEFLESQFKNHLSVNEYARRLNISEKQLNRILGAITTKSASEIIKNRIILESKRLLTCSELNINQIANELGFKDAAYFSRFFKKETKLPPSEFKNSVS